MSEHQNGDMEQSSGTRAKLPKKIVAIVIILLLVIVAVVVTIVRTNSSMKCMRVNRRPSLAPSTNPVNIPSNDSMALASFSGYLEYDNEEEPEAREMFLPLELQNVSLKASGGGQLLTLWASCAEIEIDLRLSDELYEANQVQVNVDRVDGQVDSCRVQPSTGIYFKANESYNCLSVMRFDCFHQDSSNKAKKREGSSGVRLTTLVVDSIRFEINGDPKSIANGTFSKPAHFCV